MTKKLSDRKVLADIAYYGWPVVNMLEEGGCHSSAIAVRLVPVELFTSKVWSGNVFADPPDIPPARS